MEKLCFFVVAVSIMVGCSHSDEHLLTAPECPVEQEPFDFYYGYDEMCVQWTTPFAIYTKDDMGGNLIWGWTDKEGNYGVGSFSEVTKQVGRTILGSSGGADMHNNPSVIALMDGRIGVVSCRGHNAYDRLWISTSIHASDISSFDKPVEVLGFAGATTYSQAFHLNSTYYVFTRTYSDANGWRWQVISSPDFKKWSEPKDVVLSDHWQYYVRFVEMEEETDFLRMVMYSNPSYSEQTHIRLGYINVSTGNIYSGSIDEGQVIGNYLEEAAPSFTSFDIIIQKPTDKNQRLFDVARTERKDVVVAFAQWTNAYDSEYYVYQNGVTAKVCDGGEAYIHDRAQLGARLIDKDNIAVARNSNGIDYIETYKIERGCLIKTRAIDKVYNGINHQRIQMPMLDESQHYLFYAKGSFDPSDYTVFDSDLVFVRL